jgi:hypothetical protein
VSQRDVSSVKTWLGILFIACMLVAASALMRVVHGQTVQDTTVCVAFRTITTLTGTIRSTSVTKVPCSTRPDTVTIVRRDTVNQWWALTITGDRGVYSLATSAQTKPLNFTIPTRVDTVRVPIQNPNTVELPRAYIDSRMPAQPLNGDTLYQVNAVWWCRGPSCPATLASHSLPVQLTSPPAIPAGAILILTGPNP